MAALDLTDPAERNLGLILRRHAERSPDSVFLMDGENRLSFAATNEAVNRFAVGLTELGVGRGDRIAIFMHSRVEFILLVLAVNKLGAVWVPVNTDYKGSWLTDTINDSKAKALVTDDELLDRVIEVRSHIHCDQLLVAHDGPKPIHAEHCVSLGDFNALAPQEPDLGSIYYGDTAAILWTSGTTGKPKGVMQSHNAWLRAAESGNINFETRAGDVAYNCLPLYNSAAWSASIFRALVAGIPCGLDRRFSVTEFWNRIRYYGATQTMSLGAMHMFLWNMPEQADDADNPLRVASMVPMPQTLIDPFCRRFGIELITQGFGQSEIMAMIGKINRPGVPAKPNVLGTVNEELEVRLLDDEGGEVPVGEVGEFCVRPLAPHAIFNGYFDQPEATKNAFFGDWYRMGDLGRRDTDGDFYFVDRKKDYIRYKGRNISSFEVELVAQKHPAVAAAAAFGVRSDELEWEHEIKLDVIVKPDTSVTPDELARFINDNAPYFLVPRYIELRDALPYTPTNKVEKYKLRARGVTPETWDRMKSGFELMR
jgi:crotonobetaine/carnitine-CoA ligase